MHIFIASLERIQMNLLLELYQTNELLHIHQMALHHVHDHDAILFHFHTTFQGSAGNFQKKRFGKVCKNDNFK